MKLINKEKVNTTNGWGFGGYVATVETYDNGLFYKYGKHYYRHAKPDNFNNWYILYNESHWLIRNNRTTKHKFVTIYKCITPEYTGRVAMQFTEDETTPFSEKVCSNKVNLNYEILKTVSL